MSPNFIIIIKSKTLKNVFFFYFSYTAFKKKLVEYFKKRSDDREVRDRYYTETYSKLTFAWTKKVERIENSRKTLQ